MTKKKFISSVNFTKEPFTEGEGSVRLTLYQLV